MYRRLMLMTNVAQRKSAAYLFTWKEFHDNQIITEKRGIHPGFNITTERQCLERMGRRQEQRIPRRAPGLMAGYESVIPNPKAWLLDQVVDSRELRVDRGAAARVLRVEYTAN
jgi:hypothetical protein